MKKAVRGLLALLYLFLFSVHSDAQTFNHRFDLFSNGRAQTAFDVELTPDSGYAVILGSAEEDSLGPNLYFIDPAYMC